MPDTTRTDPTGGATPWIVHDGEAPPPPPPAPHGWVPSATAWPPVHPGWQYTTAATPPRRSPWMVAGAAVAVLALAFGGGFLADRLSSSPSSSDNGGSPAIGGLPFGNTQAPGSTGPATGDTSAVAAKVTPGIVNVNVTLDNGTAAGTGMVITSTGEVLTNNHVIDGETSVSVNLPSTGRTYSAHVLGWDNTDDVALLQIEGGGSFTTVHVGNSSGVTVGESVIALGNALGRNGQPTVTSGSVSALNQTITASDSGGSNAETISNLIQITAQIQPGDSGGPLVTGDGTVVGMDTAAQVSNDRFNTAPSSVAYAIPINNALTVVRTIQAGKSTTAVHLGTTRALLGVGGQDAANGVLVQVVQAGSGAASAGITVGSTITGIDGQTVDSNTTLRNVILTHKPGDSVSISWLDTSNAPHTATITLISGPPA